MRAGIYARSEGEVRNLEAFCEKVQYSTDRYYLWFDYDLNSNSIHTTLSRLIAADLFLDLQKKTIDVVVVESFSRISQCYEYLKGFFSKVFELNSNASIVALDRIDTPVTIRNYRMVLALELAKNIKPLGFALHEDDL